MAHKYRDKSSCTRQIQHTRIENEEEIEAHYTFGSLLGKGSFGTVTGATNVADGSMWAVKAINKEKAGSAAVKLLEREVSIMKKVDHPNIIYLEEVFETTSKMYLVMELCANGGLEEALVSKGRFSEEEALCVVKQLVDAVAYIHENDIIHRDLKLDNILLAESTEILQYNIKLTDFGLSYTRGGSGSDYMMNQMVGTPMYMAPEVITNYGYSQQCDIWSIGVIMYKLIDGNAPFMANTEEELFELIQKGRLKFSSSHWSCISQAAKQLIEGMMKVDPAHRLTSKEILYHPWIKGHQDLNGSVTTNVLEMMKQYNLEQKQLAEKEKADEMNNNTEADQDDSTCRVKNDPGEKCKTETANESNEKKKTDPKPDNIKRTLSPQQASSSKTDLRSSPKHSDRKTKSQATPSYMQPTRTSKSAKNPNLKTPKKK